MSNQTYRGVLVLGMLCCGAFLVLVMIKLHATAPQRCPHEAQQRRATLKLRRDLEKLRQDLTKQRQQQERRLRDLEQEVELLRQPKSNVKGVDLP